MRLKIVLLSLFCGLACSLRGQVDLRSVEYHGTVTCEGRGVAGVRVTDGRNITATDARGRYSLIGNLESDFIYITVPAAYRIPFEGELPCIYRRVDKIYSPKKKYDFRLERNDRDETRHVFTTWADPQVYFDEEVPLLRAAADDLRELVADKYPDRPVYGMVLGDIIGEIATDTKYFDTVNRVMYGTGVPFFYVIGNHDMDTEARSNEYSKETFKNIYGPAYYSFDRGEVHYVVLDDVFLLARSYLYVGYLEEKQLAWLEQDLSYVPEGSTVIVCLHIPTYSREARNLNWGGESTMKAMTNRAHLYKLLEPYNAHIMSAHEHYNENYVLSDKLFDHVHAPVSGLFWQSYWCSDGSPSLYGVFEIDGSQVSWYYKAVGYPSCFQFHAYPVGANEQYPHAVTANVWNWDPAWKVEWYEDGVYRGEMERYTGYDPTIHEDVTQHRDNYRHKNIGAGPTEHLFRAVPDSPRAEIRVEVTDRFGRKFEWNSNEK